MMPCGSCRDAASANTGYCTTNYDWNGLPLASIGIQPPGHPGRMIRLDPPCLQSSCLTARMGPELAWG